MKHIKLFENFNKSDLEKELDKYGIKNYTINSDDTIDVDGGVSITNKRLTKIPFKFGKVTGLFDCSFNELISLEGSPKEVTGSFWCDYNRLKDLNGSPKEVGEYFNCSNNELETLEGMPLEIGKGFSCFGNSNLKTLDSVSNIEGYIECGSKIDISKFRGYCKGIRKSINGKWVDVKLNESNEFKLSLETNLRIHGINDFKINDDDTIDVDGDVYIPRRNFKVLPFKFGKVTGDFYIDVSKLETLENCPYEVGGDFTCVNNRLENLVGGPKKVKGDYIVYNNKLNSLEGSPEYLDGYFDCSTNYLKDLKGSTEEIGGSFYCIENTLESLEGMPLEIGGDFDCYDNPKLKELNSVSNIEGNICCDPNVDISVFSGYCKKIKGIRKTAYKHIWRYVNYENNIK